MTTPSDKRTLLARIPRKALAAAASIAALVLLLLYLEGAFHDKVPPGVVSMDQEPAESGRVVAVERREIEDWVDWPATVTSRQVANLAPKVMARVLEVRVGVGAAVKRGDLLAVLDDRDARSRAQQGRSAVLAAEAQAVQAEADLRRAQTLFEQRAATRQDFEAAEARARSARAQADQAREAVAESQILVGESTVRAPFDGVIGARLADPGDMAVPGQPMLVMHDPASLRLEADIPERCAGRLAPGATLPAHLGSPATELAATVEEIAPMADPQSRTVLVKAALPQRDDLRPGMFATFRLACGTHAALLVPADAVRRAGQLESVRVLVDGTARLRNVRSGRTHDGMLEILSGLQPGEAVVVGD